VTNICEDGKGLKMREQKNLWLLIKFVVCPIGVCKLCPSCYLLIISILPVQRWCDLIRRAVGSPEIIFHLSYRAMYGF